MKKKKKNEKNLELKQEYEKNNNKYWESPETKREDRKMHKKKKKFK